MSKYSFLAVFIISLLMFFSFSSSSAVAVNPDVIVNGETLETGVPAIIKNNRTLVPMRTIFNKLGAEVDWDAKSQTITSTHPEGEIKLTIGKRIAVKDGKKLELDAAPKIHSGRTLVPLRFVSEAFWAEVSWNGQSVIINNDGTKMSAKSYGINIKKKTMTPGGNQTKVTIAEIPPGADLTPTVALGDKKVGGVEELSSMASRQNAVIAVNGTFFNPEDYAGENNLPTEPYGTIIRDGELLHVGSSGAVVGFKGLDINIKQLRVKIEGSTDGSYDWPGNWFAYGVNHTPSPESSSVYIYTPERGQTVGYKFGTKVVVGSDGTVSEIIKNRDVAIPEGGYVIVLEGKDGDQLKDRFEKGVEVDYRVRYQLAGDNNLDWAWTDAAIGAGPQLLEDAKLVTNYREQGFTEDKILTNKGRRTAIGQKRDGTIVLAVADSATVAHMAQIMQKLGTVEAMNLDGGASSGLWVNGKTVVNPGRKLSNALIFVPNS